MNAMRADAKVCLQAVKIPLARISALVLWVGMGIQM